MNKRDRNAFFERIKNNDRKYTVKDKITYSIVIYLFRAVQCIVFVLIGVCAIVGLYTLCNSDVRNELIQSIQNTYF